MPRDCRGFTPASFTYRSVHHVNLILYVQNQNNFKGSYYHLAKRLLGIEYVKRVEEDEDEAGAEKNTGPVFRVLGGVAALHLALSILQTLRKPPTSPFSTATSPPLSSSNETRTFGQRCPLCLDSLGTRGVSETNSLKLTTLGQIRGHWCACKSFCGHPLSCQQCFIVIMG